MLKSSHVWKPVIFTPYEMHILDIWMDGLWLSKNSTFLKSVRSDTKSVRLRTGSKCVQYLSIRDGLQVQHDA